jgi:hypothetical protein
MVFTRARMPSAWSLLPQWSAVWSASAGVIEKRGGRDRELDKDIHRCLHLRGWHDGFWAASRVRD